MKWIEEFENLYKISKTGKVFSVRSDRFLKNSPSSTGYHKVVLYNNGFRKTMSVHRLVAEAFIPNPENKPEVNHIDGNKQNNNVSNLEWSTSSENQKHAHKIGLAKSKRGTNHIRCTLSEEEVLAIKDYKAKGKYPTEISRVMDLKLSRVKDVYYGYTLGWLKV